ncbi:hypothetical protein TNCV_4384591 [Trichonephila clavipes]|nr:hypothetical protein TNCV_4384591 [Trichonephila clavipes]
MARVYETEKKWEPCDGALSRLLINPLGKSLGPEWHYFNPILSRRNRNMQIIQEETESQGADHHEILAVTKRVFQSIDCGTSCVTCCAVFLEPQLLDIMIVQFRNEKVSNHGSIPITIDCNVVAFIVFEEGFHQPIKRTKQSVFLDVTVFRRTLVD